MRHVAAAVSGCQIAACKVRTDVPCDARRDRGRVARRASVDVRCGGDECLVLQSQPGVEPLELRRLLPHFADKAPVGDRARQSANRQQNESGDLWDEVPLEGVELGDDNRDHGGDPGQRHREPPLAVKHPGRDGEQAGHAGKRDPTAVATAGVEGGAGQDQHRGGRREGDPEPQNPLR